MSDPIRVMGSQELRVFLRGGCARLGSKQDEVNALNVFPVPDGDTGVNMYLTVASGEKKMLTAVKNGETTINLVDEKDTEEGGEDLTS